MPIKGFAREWSKVCQKNESVSAQWVSYNNSYAFRLTL